VRSRSTSSRDSCWGNSHCRVLSSHRQDEEGERDDREFHFYDNKKEFLLGVSDDGAVKKEMNESILYT
jgi:hypothetical protein